MEQDDPGVDPFRVIFLHCTSQVESFQMTEGAARKTDGSLEHSKCFRNEEGISSGECPANLTQDTSAQTVPV